MPVKTSKQRLRAARAHWNDSHAVAWLEGVAGLTPLQFEAFTLQRRAKMARSAVALVQGNHPQNVTVHVRGAVEKIKAARGERLGDPDAPSPVIDALHYQPQPSMPAKPADAKAMRGLPAIGALGGAIQGTRPEDALRNVA